MKHQDATLNHPPYNFTFANAAARAAGTGYTIVTADLGKFARQTDDNTIWMLTATVPTWVKVGSATPDSVRVYRTTNQTITSGASTPISADTESYDLGNGMWVIGSPTKLTAVIAGVYSVFCTIRWANNATGYRLLFVNKNSATIAPAEGRPGNSVSDLSNTMTLAGQVRLAISDFIEFVVNQNSGGNLDLLNSADFYPVMGMTLIRAD